MNKSENMDESENIRLRTYQRTWTNQKTSGYEHIREHGRIRKHQFMNKSENMDESENIRL